MHTHVHSYDAYTHIYIHRHVHTHHIDTEIQCELNRYKSYIEGLISRPKSREKKIIKYV